MSMQRIIVDLEVIDRKIQSFEGKRDTLSRIMSDLSETMVVVSRVTWISPASTEFFLKFRRLYDQILEAIKIVEEYIHDLSVVRQQYDGVETSITDRVSGLQTNVFGV